MGADPVGPAVLYLDDDESLVMLVTHVLERMGFRASGFTDAAEALAEVRTEPGRFDLVVTDHTMLSLTGVDVAHELRRIRADLPVVLVSGHIGEELRGQARRAGVHRLLRKPNSVEGLGTAIEGIMRGIGQCPRGAGAG